MQRCLPARVFPNSEFTVDDMCVTSITDSDASLSNLYMTGSDHHFGRHVIRVVWLTANIVFVYARFADVSFECCSSWSQSVSSRDVVK